MTEKQARESVFRLRQDPDVESATLVRILPEDLDPVQPLDRGWDVEITLKDHLTNWLRGNGHLALASHKEEQ